MGIKTTGNKKKFFEGGLVFSIVAYSVVDPGPHPQGSGFFLFRALYPKLRFLDPELMSEKNWI
jgi:hypothetical protein